MAAGLSSKQIYGRIYNRLQSIRYKLVKAGVETIYRKSQIFPDVTKYNGTEADGFNISFDTWRASNGETGGFAKCTIFYNDSRGTVQFGHMLAGGSFEQGIAEVVRIYGRTQ
jgi:hypothetical protein